MIRKMNRNDTNIFITKKYTTVSETVPLPNGTAIYTDGGEELKHKCEVTNCTNCV